jgi:peptidylprolyl isomerase
VPFSLVRRRQAAVAAVLAASALALAACGASTASSSPKPSASGSGSSSPASSPSGSASATATPTTSVSAGPVVFPTVSGGYGTKPTLTFPKATPSSKLGVKVLSAGTGPAIQKSDLLVADYLGQIWNGKVFDNSYDRKQPFGTPIGEQQVIPGWDTALVGQKVGSRVLLVVPPAEGYGATGNSGAGIKGTDTLAFVIDIINKYDSTAKADTNAVPQNASTGDVTVTGALGTAPKVTVKKGAAIPKAETATILAKSSGAPITSGLVVMQYVATYYDGTSGGSSYEQKTPYATGVGSGDTSNPFEKLVGVPVGSRVLLTLPTQDSSGKTVGIAVVVDVVAVESSAKPK